MTVLTLYATTQLDSLLPNAAQVVTAPGASSSTTNHTAIGTNSGWGELGFGGNPAWASGSSPGPANGYGCIYDSTALEGQTFAAGTWTFKTNVKTSAGSETGVLELMLYKYNSNSNTYTSIGTLTMASATYTTGGVNVSISGSLSAVAFGIADKLYWELWFQSNSHSGTPGNMLVTTSNSATQGYAGAGEMDTPGYSPTANPHLSISPTSLSFSATAGGASPASQNTTLSEINGYATAWTSSISYGSGSGWLSILPISGNLSASGSQSISVSCATGSLTAGTYTATITCIASTGGSQASVNVTFLVVAPGPPPASNQTLSTRDGKITLYARDGKATLTARGN